MRRSWQIAIPLAVGILAVVPAEAAAPPNGTYRGRTSEDFPITLKVSGGAVRMVLTTVHNDCGRTHGVAIGGKPLRIDARGRFSADYSFGGGGGTHMVGRFRGERVSGTLRERAPLESGRLCDTGVLPYSARR